MTGMLASVSSLPEALQILTAKVDIIDLKQPAKGALGALTLESVATIVNSIQGQCPISATIGDLSMQPDLVFNAVKMMATTKVDYIKVGLFPEGDTVATLIKLAELIPLNLTLIAVLFADALPCLSIINDLKIAGFKGVMLDTLDKQQGALTQIMPLTQIMDFVMQVKQQSLLCGLAGSLTLTDIKPLLGLNPDYLGFRGALCQQHNRVAALDYQAITTIQKQVYATQ
jgi:uncharacterized protein (UPF0264 family)